MKGPSTTETVLGQTTIVVRLADGREEHVVVRQLPIRMFGELLAALDDECRMISLATGKPLEWVHGLPPDQHERLIGEVDRLNADFFSRWLARRQRRLETLVPNLGDRLLSQVFRSDDGSRKPPSSSV